MGYSWKGQCTMGICLKALTVSLEKEESLVDALPRSLELQIYPWEELEEFTEEMFIHRKSVNFKENCHSFTHRFPRLSEKNSSIGKAVLR
jgi:hypothetical protein